MLNLEAEIGRLLKKHPDPRKGGEGLREFRERQAAEGGAARFGTVVDNKDRYYDTI